jgi:SepF-like predicted cell division protein (DUF552 family)
MVVRRLYSGNVIINDYVVLAVKCRDSQDYVIIGYNIARIKTLDDHWYISTFYSRDYVIINYNIARIKTLEKCRDIPMVVRRLYSGNVIVNDYVGL